MHKEISVKKILVIVTLFLTLNVGITRANEDQNLEPKFDYFLNNKSLDSFINSMILRQKQSKKFREAILNNFKDSEAEQKIKKKVCNKLVKDLSKNKKLLIKSFKKEEYISLTKNHVHKYINDKIIQNDKLEYSSKYLNLFETCYLENLETLTKNLVFIDQKIKEVKEEHPNLTIEDKINLLRNEKINLMRHKEEEKTKIKDILAAKTFNAKSNYSSFKYGIQERNLSCESKIASDILNARGWKTTEWDISNLIPRFNGLPIYLRNGSKIWGDPEKEFVGSYNGMQSSTRKLTGYGVYEKPISEVFNKFGLKNEPVSNGRIEDMIKDFILGRDIMFWFADLKRTNGLLVNIIWNTKEGNRVAGVVGEHVGIITNIAGDLNDLETLKITFHEPNNLEKHTVNFKEFEKFFTATGKRRIKI